MAQTISQSDLNAMIASAVAAALAGSAQATPAQVVTAQAVPVPAGNASNYAKLPASIEISVNGKVVASLAKKFFSNGTNYGFYGASFKIGEVEMQAVNIFVHKNSR